MLAMFMPGVPCLLCEEKKKDAPFVFNVVLFDIDKFTI